MTGSTGPTERVRPTGSGLARLAGSGSQRPAHLRVGLVAVVALGGALGTSARALLSGAMHPAGGLPVATLLENVVGAFLLGLLLEALVRTHGENATRRTLRLGLGTGALGGFTTFSTLALEVHDLIAAGRLGLALGYGLGSVALGLAAGAAGVWLGSRRRSPHGRGS